MSFRRVSFVYICKESKVVICPRCNTKNHEDREKCRICLFPLENICSDDVCNCLNSPKARYCKKCGQPTRFLILKAFDEEHNAIWRQSAKNYFEVNGDPDSPEAKEKKARKHIEKKVQMVLDKWVVGEILEYEDDEPSDDPNYPYY